MMLEATIHYRGREPEQRTLPVLPRAGDFLDTDNALWHVDAVVLRAHGIDVYCIQVAENRAAELRAKWAGWSEPVEEPENETPGANAP